MRATERLCHTRARGDALEVRPLFCAGDALEGRPLSCAGDALRVRPLLRSAYASTAREMISFITSLLPA